MSELKQLAARDFEDLLQASDIVDGLTMLSYLTAYTVCNSRLYGTPS